MWWVESGVGSRPPIWLQVVRFLRSPANANARDCLQVSNRVFSAVCCFDDCFGLKVGICDSVAAGGFRSIAVFREYWIEAAQQKFECYKWAAMIFVSVS